MNSKPLISLTVMLLAATSPLTSLEWQKSWGTLPLLAQTTEDRQAEANRLLDQGNQHDDHSQYREAIQSYEQALKIYQEIGNREGEADSYNNLGIVYSKLGEYETAICFYEKSLDIFTEIGDRQGEVYSYGNLGIAYHHLEDYQKAISFYKQSLPIFTQTDDRNGEAGIYMNLGLAYHHLEDYQKAISFYKQSLPIFTQTDDRNGEALSYNNLGIVYDKLGEYETAISFYEKSLAIFTEIGDREGEGLSLSNMGFLLEKQNEPETAIIFFKQSVNIREGIRRDIQGLSTELQQSYTETIANTYRRLADLLLSQDRILEAQQILELLKTQEVQEFTRNRSIRGEIKDVTFLPQEEKIIQQYDSLIAFANTIKQCEDNQCPQLKALRDQRDELKGEYSESIKKLQKLIRERQGSDDAFFDPTELSQTSEKIISASDQHNTQPGTMVIYPLVLDDKLRLLFATKGKVVGSREIKQISRQQLNDTVVKLRLALESPNSDITELQNTSKQLYEWLIKPIEKELTEGNINHLVFSLDRATRYIPMQVLYDGENYLIENYTVTNVINTQLTDTKDRLPDTIEANKILAVGGSNIPGQRKLDHVETEIDFIVKEENNPNDIQGIYPGLAFLNEDFHRENLRDNLGDRKLLHIATHGKFTTGSQYDSYLVLGNGEKLTIADIEILGDYLDDVHLVVLSACETALGDSLIVDPNREEGVEINALSYYFLTGGAKTIMASLWQVDDNGTSELMQQFYAKLSQSNQTLTKAEALQKVQLDLLSNPQLKHPHYWSPFILMGNGI